MHLVNALERKHLYIVVKSVPIREQHTSFTSRLNGLLAKLLYPGRRRKIPAIRSFIRLYTFKIDLHSLTSNRPATTSLQHTNGHDSGALVVNSTSLTKTLLLLIGNALKFLIALIFSHSSLHYLSSYIFRGYVLDTRQFVIHNLL